MVGRVSVLAGRGVMSRVARGVAVGSVSYALTTNQFVSGDGDEVGRASGCAVAEVGDGRARTLPDNDDPAIRPQGQTAR